MDEDGHDTRIAAPEIQLVKELSRIELAREGVMWIVKHPHIEIEGVEKNTGTALDDYVIVRGKNPTAKGKMGSTIFLLKENKSGEIAECAEYLIDGEEYLPDTKGRGQGGGSHITNRSSP